MKLFILECTKDELRANRGIMDAIVDVCRETMDAFGGITTPCPTEQEDEEEV